MEEHIKQSRAGLIPCVLKNNHWYIALMKPSNPKYGGTDWQLAKGVVEENDDFKTTAVKECQQELGITININNIKLLWYNKQTLTQWFFVELKSLLPMKPGPNEDGIIETGETIWMEINQAEEEIRDWQKPIIKMLKRRLGI